MGFVRGAVGSMLAADGAAIVAYKESSSTMLCQASYLAGTCVR